MITSRIKISEAFAGRLDVSFYKKRYNFTSKTYPSFRLSQLVEVNPPINLREMSADTEISFIPMEVIDEKNGVVSEYRKTTVSKSKGFTKFEDGDLIWAKITPCMQNGKSAIVSNMMNGIGCGSTEFYVLRPKECNILIEYVYYILRDRKVLDAAKDSFGGSAGQQRVSLAYLKSIMIPLPPISIQQEIVALYQKAQDAKQTKEAKAKALLASVDSEILKQLGIATPEVTERRLCFKVSISDIVGNRCDPQFYNPKYSIIVDAIKSKPYVKLGDVANFSKETWNQEDYFETNFPYIEISSIDISNGELNEVVYIDKKGAPSRAKKIARDKDILVSTTRPNRGAIGLLNISDINICSTGFAVIREVEDYILKDYLMMILRHHYSLTQMAQRSSGGNYPAITEEELRKIVIPLPSMQLQKQIIDLIATKKTKAKQLQQEGATLLKEAKEQIAKIILG